MVFKLTKKDLRGSENCLKDKNFARGNKSHFVHSLVHFLKAMGRFRSSSATWDSVQFVMKN